MTESEQLTELYIRLGAALKEIQELMDSIKLNKSLSSSTHIAGTKTFCSGCREELEFDSDGNVKKQYKWVMTHPNYYR